MTDPSDSASQLSAGSVNSRLGQGAGVIVIGGAMFTFIGYWRTAAIVLCDLASTAYYIGAIVEQSIDPDDPGTKLFMIWGAVVLACSVTLYFFRENLRGIHESSEKALRIMVIT